MIEGFVYFAQSSGPDGHIKIGFSKFPSVRLKALQTGSGYAVVPIVVLPATTKHERHLHRVLAAHRVIGEWFCDCEQVRGAIESAKSGNWCDFTPPAARDITRFAEQATALATFIKSTAEYLGVWSLRKGEESEVFGVSTWLVWKFFYRSTEPRFSDLEALLEAKAKAADQLLSVAMDARDDANGRIEFLANERAETAAMTAELQAVDRKIDGYFASIGKVRPPLITTPEEDAEIRRQFEIDLKRTLDRRDEAILAKIAAKKGAK